MDKIESLAILLLFLPFWLFSKNDCSKNRKESNENVFSAKGIIVSVDFYFTDAFDRKFCEIPKSHSTNEKTKFRYQIGSGMKLKIKDKKQIETSPILLESLKKINSYENI